MKIRKEPKSSKKNPNKKEYSFWQSIEQSFYKYFFG